MLFLAATFFISQAIAQSLTDGLELHYNFKEAIGINVMDQAGANDGTLINGATIGSDEEHPYLDLIEVDAGVLARPYMEIGAGAGSIIASLTDFTIAFFMKVPTGYKSDFTWEFSNSFDQANEALGHMFFDAVHQKTAITLTNYLGEDGNKIDLQSSVPVDVWFHYAFTFKEKEGIYYVDAVPLDTAMFVNQPSDLGPTQYNWIGRCGYDEGGATAGQYNINPAKIADFRLYSRALTTEEVTALSNGEGETSSIHSSNFDAAIDIYPNPFQNVTNITFGVDRKEMVKLEIYSVDGKIIETLVNDEYMPGDYDVFWNAEQHENGIYFSKLQIGEMVEVRKLIKQ